MRFELPTLPGAQARVRSLLATRDVDFGEVGRLVETDPALTTAMLRAANSAASTPVSPITTVKQALVRIGSDQTRRIVSSAVMGSTFTGLQQAGLDARELWQHVVACALLAGATAWGGVSGSAALTDGLLYDLGRLAMAHQMPARYAEVVRLVHEGLSPTWAETRVLGLDHMEAGLAVARAWQIPDEVSEAIADHHGGDAGALGWLTVNARRIAWSLGIGDGLLCPGEPSFDPLSEDAEVLATFGGPQGFVERVDWHCDLLTTERRAA